MPLTAAARRQGLGREAVRKQAALFRDLEFNAFYVDQRLAGSRVTYDAPGRFFGKVNFGVTGRLWVEFKVFSERRFGRAVAEVKEELEHGLEQARRHDETLQGVL